MKELSDKPTVIVVFLLILLLSASTVRAATLEVCKSDCIYTKIQAAIDAAVDGDTVLVNDGTYMENINFKGKAIIVKSVNGSEKAIIDGSQPVDPNYGSVVVFISGEGNDSVLDGFSIINGSGTKHAINIHLIYGGGIYCDSSSPTIINCIIKKNSAPYGGGISCHNSTVYNGDNLEFYPTITNCIITENTALHGGGTYFDGISATIIKCIINGNSAEKNGGGVLYSSVLSSSLLIITNSIIADNLALRGGGAVLSNPTIINNCTISGNWATHEGGGIYNSTTSLAIINSILWNNAAGSAGNEILTSGNIEISYSNIKVNWPGIGNISSDPLFIDPENGDYHLKSNSPCIDAGKSENAPINDIEGTARPQGARIDIGAYEYSNSYAATFQVYPVNSFEIVFSNLHVQIWFEKINTNGLLTVLDKGKEGPDLPSGFQVGGHYYDITMDADYSGKIIITFNYSAMDVKMAKFEENALLVLRYNTDSKHWEDITTPDGPITYAGVIRGDVTSLSSLFTFAISPTAYIDVDKDAYPLSVDCNDNDPNINPDIADICDGIDNDCDDQVDEEGDAPCDDGLFCNGPELCMEGICQAETAPCDDNIDCTIDVCDETNNNCKNTPDNNLCDNNICSVSICVPTVGCVDGSLPDGINCDDGNICTTNDTCSNGTCIGGLPPEEVCDDNLDNDCDGWTDEDCSPPEFITYIDLDTYTDHVEICFVPDKPLKADPVITSVIVNGITQSVNGLNPLISDYAPQNCRDLPGGASMYCTDYYYGPTDKEIEITTEEAPDNCIVPGSPGSGIAGFTIDPDNKFATSFCLYNGDTGSGSFYDAQCNEIASIKSDPGVLDLIGSDLDGGCIILRITEFYSDAVPIPPDIRITDVYDFNLPEEIMIAQDKTLTLTLDFNLPEGTTRTDYENGNILFDVYRFNETTGKWTTDGITIINIWWDSDIDGSITFTTNHLSKFTASFKQSPVINIDSNSNNGGGGGNGNGGCSLTLNTRISTVSLIINTLILLFPFFIIRFKSKKTKTKPVVRTGVSLGEVSVNDFKFE